MNKQELQNEINKTKEHLANMEKMLAECKYEYGRWKPEENEKFFYMDESGEIYESNFDSNYIFDNNKIAYYNCFQTREQAEAEAEKILVRRMLEDIARRLNKGEKIDWNDSGQRKYSLYLDNKTNRIGWSNECGSMMLGLVYCLDMNFYKDAIQEIGEERLKKYLRGE